MPRAFKVMLVIFALIVGVWFLWLVAPAHAHSFYEGIRDPVTGFGCCGGLDCKPVPLDSTWVQPVADGFKVTMTAEQAREVNPNAKLPINEIVPWTRVMMPPAGAKGTPALYHICIWSSQLKCLFVVPGM